MRMGPGIRARERRIRRRGRVAVDNGDAEDGGKKEKESAEVREEAEEKAGTLEGGVEGQGLLS